MSTCELTSPSSRTFLEEISSVTWSWCSLDGATLQDPSETENEMVSMTPDGATIQDPSETENEMVSMYTRWGYDPRSIRDGEWDGEYEHQMGLRSKIPQRQRTRWWEWHQMGLQSKIPQRRRTRWWVWTPDGDTIQDPSETENRMLSMNTRWGCKPRSLRDRERDGEYEHQMGLWHTRHDLQDHHTQARKCAGKRSTLDLKPMRKDTWSLIRRYQLLHKMGLCPTKNKQQQQQVLKLIFCGW